MLYLWEAGYKGELNKSVEATKESVKYGFQINRLLRASQ